MVSSRAYILDVSVAAICCKVNTGESANGSYARTLIVQIMRTYRHMRSSHKAVCCGSYDFG